MFTPVWSSALKPVGSVSFVIPSMNEADNVENVVREIAVACAAVQNLVESVQLVLVNDGSTDNTGEVIERIAARHPNALCVHHPKNLGFGAAYKSGVLAASNNYVFMVPGENSVPAESMIAVLSSLGKAEMLITYPLNPVVRKKVRQLLSIGFQRLTKWIFAQDIHYYNGPNLYQRAHVLSALPKTNGHAYQLEMILKLLSVRRTYVQIGINVRSRPIGKSKALLPKNVARVIWVLMRCIFWAAFTQRTKQAQLGSSALPH
jgi:glycosyltransferase involved in cell wall biosynthesis